MAAQPKQEAFFKKLATHLYVPYKLLVQQTTPQSSKVHSW
jgi:hypothetical protein